MKIVDVVPHVLSTPLEESFSFSQGWVDRRSAMIVEVTTDEGVTGWGESLCHGLQPPEVAAGENLFGKIGYRRWISEGALDILQPDLCSSGGFTECKKIAAVAQAWNTAVVPHVWGSGIGLAASLQLIATLPPTPLSLHPEEPMLEYDRSSHPFRADLIGGAISTVDGKVPVPHGPGIGVEVDRTVLERYGKPFR